MEKEYLGAGALGEIAAGIDAEAQARRRAERAAWRSERRAQSAIDREIDTAAAELRAVIGMVLRSHGFHQHKGTWRKRRSRMTSAEGNVIPADKSTSARKLLTAFQAADDKASLKTLKGYFASDPTLWRLVDMAHESAMGVIAKENDLPKMRVIGEANYEGQLRELGHDGSPPLERMLIEHVGLCWLRLEYVEQKYSAVMAQEGLAIDQAEYWERRLSATQRRYLRACEVLARVRRLRLPVMQVNIGEQQVNVTQ